MPDLFNISHYWQAEDATSRIEVTRRFLAAQSKGEYERLCDEYPLMFGWQSSPTSPDEYAEVCEVLRTAERLFALYHVGGKLDENALWDCKVSVSPSGWVDPNSSDESGETTLTSVTISLTYNHLVRSAQYAAWLTKAQSAVSARGLGYRGETMDFRNGWLTYHAGGKHVSLDMMSDDCSEILRQLFNLHLADVGAVVEAPDMRQQYIPYSGVSLLWLGLSELMSGGRPFLCEACGKPCIAYGERRVRRYCSPACRKWANKHHGEKREHWYIEQR